MRKEMIIEKYYREDNKKERELKKKLKKAEEQIKNGEVTDADIVFSQMREKYGY